MSIKSNRISLFLNFTGSILNARCGGSVYRYPLADYTGTAEVVHGGSSGYSGLGEVTSFQPHPSLPYNSLYFHGTAASYLELMLGGDYTLKNDWSFTMFVYSIEPHRGTIFDLVYEGRTQQKTGFFFKQIKLELTDSNIVLTMHGPSGQDYGSATVGTIFTAEEWMPLTVVHDKANGDVIMFTEAQEFYNSKQIQDNQNNIVIQQPAKIKLGGAYQDHTPFKGSIVCFLVYDMKVSKNHFPSALDECQPENWIIKDNIIGNLY